MLSRERRKRFALLTRARFFAATFGKTFETLIFECHESIVTAFQRLNLTSRV
jgi:hypothetical protein